MTRPSRATSVAERRVASTDEPYGRRLIDGLSGRDSRGERDGRRGQRARTAPARAAPAGAPAAAGSCGAKVASMACASATISLPSGESGLVCENGEPVFCAEIAVRYSLVILVSKSRFNALSAAPTEMPVNAFERLRTSLSRFGSKQ